MSTVVLYRLPPPIAASVIYAIFVGDASEVKHTWSLFQ
jgi:hypothetical protein